MILFIIAEQGFCIYEQGIYKSEGKKKSKLTNNRYVAIFLFTKKWAQTISQTKPLKELTFWRGR